MPRHSFDLDELRRNHSLLSIVGADVKLRRAGAEWKACCPLHNDNTPSFTIYKGGNRFHCFGCGAGGDVFDYLQRLHGITLPEAAAMLGAGEVPTIEVAPAVPANDGGSDRLEEARLIWRNSVPASGTLAETYLRWRGINISIPESIRFGSLRYGKRGREHPCLVAAVSEADNRLSGIQRTYLAYDGEGKADVPKPKLSLGKVSGGAIRLAPVAAKMVVCSGLEDGLTLQQGLGPAVWVATGDSVLPSMRFPPLVRSVAIGGDNDEAGRAAAVKSAKAYAERGLECRMFFALPPHKDFNSEIMKGGK